MNARHQPDLFAAGARMVAEEAVDLTVASLLAYGERHEHWAVAWSGGKDSTAAVTLLVRLVEEGRIPRPRHLSVFYADTPQELPPLQAAADAIAAQLRQRDWISVEVVRAPLDKRFLVYMLGRGVPPPNNTTFRWCTRQIKVDPMAAAIKARLAALDGSVLMITGVRQGESAVRDRRIEMSCSKDGGECGQGWYQQVLPQSRGIRGRIATLAPLLHWRVCHVWDWLKVFAPRPVEAHRFVPDGAIVWMAGRDVLAWTSKERADFLALFGFREVPKVAAGCTGMMVSPADYAALAEHLGKAAA